MQEFDSEASLCAQVHTDTQPPEYMEMVESSGTVTNDAENMQQRNETTMMAIEDHEDDNNVDVQIKFLGDDRLSLRCKSDIHISALKERVLEAKAMQEEASDNMYDESRRSAPLRLIYKGRVLKNDQLLQSYNFNSGDTIHAVFGLPNRNTAGNAQDAGNTNSAPQNEPANESTAPNPNANGNGQNAFFQSFGDGVMMGQIDIGANEGSTMPEWNTLFGSILSGLQNASGNGPTVANIRLFTDGANDMMNGIVMNQEGSALDTSTNQQTQGNSAEAAHTVEASGTTETTQSDRSNPGGQNVNDSDQGTQTPSLESRAASVLNQAASIRRSIPPLELNPLTRPPELSSELYTMGNAFREAGDTFLAIHRQLQFLSARFLQAHRLTVNEQTRLHNRVQRLIPSLRGVQSLAGGLATTLESSPFNTPTTQPEARSSTGGDGAHAQGVVSIRLRPVVNVVGQDQAGAQVLQGNEDNAMVRFMTAMLSGAVQNAQSSTPATASESTQSEAAPPNSSLASETTANTTELDERSETSPPDTDDILSDSLNAVADRVHHITENQELSSKEVFASVYEVLSDALKKHSSSNESICTELQSRILLALQQASAQHSFPNLASDSLFLGLLHTTVQHLLHICVQREGQTSVDAFRQTCQHLCGTIFWHFLNANDQNIAPVKGTADIIVQIVLSIASSASLQRFGEKLHNWIVLYLNAMMAIAR
ncbi:unnamed protein product [Albugo candida]|nr:unnamed protein product [Albugo candida]|eukprot:CCI44283.1 unnamed protein product [Albugo candida]